MMNRGKGAKTFSVTFHFRGHKAEEAATALFIQWLDGGMADGFEDYMNGSEGIDMVHDWDDSIPGSYVFHITTKKAQAGPS